MQKTNEILRTKDYDSFSYINGNRDIDELKLKQLVESFKKRPSKIFVKVNNKNQVIDGQHRIEVARKLNKWVYCINIGKGGIETVMAENSTNNAWKKKTFLYSYTKMGIEPYVRFREFMDNNKDFGMAACLTIFTNRANAPKMAESSTIDGRRVYKTRIFEEGQLEMPDLSLAYENAGKIRQYKPYYSGYNRRSFVATLIGLFKNKKFDNDVMLRKLSLQPTALQHCATIEQYKALMERIYNYKNGSKLNFRIS